MTESKPTYQGFDSIHLLSLIVKWKKHLLILALAAIVISAVVSFIITPMFKATVTLFPVRPGSVSKDLFSPAYAGDKDILRFGEEDDSERMMEVLNSEEIMNRLDKKYDLLKHYEIKPDHPYKKTLLREEYKDNITFKKTEYQSVLITVLDHSPDTSAMIANDIAALLDSVIFDMQRERAEQGFIIIEEEYMKKEAEIKQLKDSINYFRKAGVQDYDMYTRQHAKALASGKESGAKAIEGRLDVLAKMASTYTFMKERLLQEATRFTELRTKYLEAKVDIEKRLPQKFIVQSASVPEKKYTPVRWLIVVVSTLSTLLLGLLTIIAMENYNSYKQKAG